MSTRFQEFQGMVVRMNYLHLKNIKAMDHHSRPDLRNTIVHYFRSKTNNDPPRLIIFGEQN
jgi:hypothetical protein